MTIHLIELKNVPILDQLKLEEALLRTDKRNICLINSGAPLSIVMGISGNPTELLNLPLTSSHQVPVIKRFSGGGTVVVDEQTLFVSFIFQKEFHGFPLFPEHIYSWVARFYRSVFQHPEFHFRENDFVLGNRKCGGNAQYIQKNRFLHHSTFLWDFSEKHMQYLQLPKKRPEYRQDRPHHAFLTRLRDHFSSLDALKADIIRELKRVYNVCDLSLEEILPLVHTDHRKSTSLINLS